MGTEKSCNLSEQQIDLTQEKGTGTSLASLDEHLPKSSLFKLTTFCDSRVQDDQQSYIPIFVVCQTLSSWSLELQPKWQICRYKEQHQGKE